MFRYLFAFILTFSFTQDTLSGYLRETEMSFCMDDCSQYQIETEIDSDFGSIFVVFDNEEVDVSMYLNRFVEVTVGEEIDCTECSASQILRINLSDECVAPVTCFADPCAVADECQLNTPIDCVSNYCGGCYADFYDLNNNLVDCYGDDDNEGEPSPCLDFGQEDCEWFDECVWTDNGCQDFDNGDEDIECSDFDNEEECRMNDCEWEYSNNMPGGAFCVEPNYNEDECRYFESEDECLTAGCEWEDNVGCYDASEDNDGDGSPECLSDCEGINLINPDEDPYAACDWIVSNFGPNNFFNECAEDCDEETMMEINEYMEACFQCLADNNCDDMFEDEEEDIECSDFDNEEECRMSDCDWQLTPTGLGYCIEADDNFEPVCEDLSGVMFGDCEMIIGIGWNGQECTWYSGCGPTDENGVDYSNALFDSMEECQAVCSNNQGLGYLYGSVEYVWGDAIEMVSGAILQITSVNAFYITETNEQGYYSIEIPEGQYSVSVEAYGESQVRDVYIMSNQEHEVSFSLGEWYYPSVLMGRVLCADCDEEFSPISEANIVISNPNNWVALETFSDEEGYFFADLPAGGMYNVMISKDGYSDYAEYVSVQGYTQLDFYLSASSSGGDGYAMLSLENITTAPGSEVSQGLFLESDLEVGGLQFSIYAEGEGFPNYILEAGIASMNDCFSASSNYTNGALMGIVFSLEGCTYPPNEQIHIADLNYYISDNTPLGIDIMMNFENTLVSDAVGNEILSYGEGGFVSLGILGDVNLDAELNILDVISIVNFAIYIEEPTDSEFWAADLNSDNMLDILDIVIIVNMILDN